jgi:hypothetical protein
MRFSLLSPIKMLRLSFSFSWSYLLLQTYVNRVREDISGYGMQGRFCGFQQVLPRMLSHTPGVAKVQGIVYLHTLQALGCVPSRRTYLPCVFWLAH